MSVAGISIIVYDLYILATLKRGWQDDRWEFAVPKFGLKSGQAATQEARCTEMDAPAMKRDSNIGRRFL
jgi:hypothetical protein